MLFFSIPVKILAILPLEIFNVTWKTNPYNHLYILCNGSRYWLKFYSPNHVFFVFRRKTFKILSHFSLQNFIFAMGKRAPQNGEVLQIPHSSYGGCLFISVYRDGLNFVYRKKSNQGTQVNVNFTFSLVWLKHPELKRIILIIWAWRLIAEQLFCLVRCLLSLCSSRLCTFLCFFFPWDPKLKDKA